MNKYYLNLDITRNPNGNNEVHCEGCRVLREISYYNIVDLGYCENGIDAVKVAKAKGYSKADGCYICSPEAHRE